MMEDETDRCLGYVLSCWSDLSGVGVSRVRRRNCHRYRLQSCTEPQAHSLRSACTSSSRRINARRGDSDLAHSATNSAKLPRSRLKLPSTLGAALIEAGDELNAECITGGRWWWIVSSSVTSERAGGQKGVPVLHVEGGHVYGVGGGEQRPPWSPQ